jgi:hypothetical protein
VRERPLDPVVIRNNWLTAYAFLADAAINKSTSDANGLSPHSRRCSAGSARAAGCRIPFNHSIMDSLARSPGSRGYSCRHR